MKTSQLVLRVFAFILLMVVLSSSSFSIEPGLLDKSIPSVRITPSLVAVKSGKTFTVDILVDPGNQTLNGCLANISFDPGLMQVEKVTPGEALGDDPQIEPGYPVIENTRGLLCLSAICKKGQDLPKPGIFYTIVFSVKTNISPATSAITIDEAKLTGDNGKSISNVMLVNGQVKIISLQVAQVRFHPFTRIPEKVTDIEDIPSTLKSGTVFLTEQNIDTVYKDFLKEKQSFFMVNPEQLQLISKEKKNKKWFIQFQQHYQGIPVYHATVGFIANEQGNVISYGSSFHPNINIDMKEKISIQNAADCIRKTLDRSVAQQLTQKDGSKLIYPEKQESGMVYHLAWKFTLSGSKPNHQVDRVYIVDAITGTTLRDYPLYGPETTISGKVQGEIYPENPTDPPLTTSPLNHSYVSPGGTTQYITNSTGDYSGTVTGSITNVTFKLEGPYAKVDNWVTSNPYTVTVNYTGSPCNQTWTSTDRDHINVFYHINLLHDWYQSHCAYNWINAWDNSTQFKAQVNYTDNNAYAGSPMLFGSDNYARSSDIIYHECSHNVLYKIYGDWVGYGVSSYCEGYAFDEGFADFFACAMTNESLQGEGAGGGRDLNNTIQYVGKLNYYTEGHSGGRIIAGAAWDLRTMLIAEMGSSSGSQYADRLVLEAHQTMASMPREYYFSDPQESNFLQSLYIADDDNANLADGVPHFTEIHHAFGHHNLLQAVLNTGDSYDITTNTLGSYSGGDFYYYQGKFWANNLNQRGVKDLGDIGTTIGLDKVEIKNPDSGYTRFGVTAALNHTYVSLAQQGEEGNYIVFRVTWISPDSSQISIQYYYRKNRITLKDHDSYDFSDQLRRQLTGGDFYFTQSKFWANNVGQVGVIGLGNIGNVQLDQVAIPGTGYTRFGVDAVSGNTYVSKAQQGEEEYYIIFRVVNITASDVTIDYLYRKRNQVTFFNQDSYDFSQQIRGQLTGGEFYLTGLYFYANNVGQRGVISLGNIGTTPLDQVTIPETGYTRFGVSAVTGNTYVSLAQQGEEGHYIVFRVDAVEGTSVRISYLYK